MPSWFGGVIAGIDVAQQGRARVGSPLAEQCAEVVKVLYADHHDAQPDEFAGWPDLTAVFGLEAADVMILQAAAAAELDGNVAAAFGLLRGLTHASRATVGLALELAGVGTTTPDAFGRLGPAGPLRRARLLDVPGDGPWLTRALVVPDPVLAVLAGARPAEPTLDGLRTVAVALETEGSADLAAAIGLDAPLAWVRCPPGAAGTAMAADALRSLGLDWVAVDVGRRSIERGWSELAGHAVREAALRGRALIVTGAETIPEDQAPAVFEILADAVVPVVAVGNRAWDPAWLHDLPYLAEAAPLPVDAREQMWSTGLGALVDDDSELRRTLLGLRLVPESVPRVTRHAQLLADTRDEPVSAHHVREAARRVSGSGGASGNVRAGGAAGSRPTLDDLVLPETATTALQELVSWARHRDEVARQGLLARRGCGIAALFAGGPGTGKTLAAHVVAAELSVDLFQVDLSSVVDKYIGETEKNLERIFHAAETMDVVLFFDEADALFGSRSEVKDARDRYANQEISYLLQRMEHFDGVTILATNLRGNLDRAFSRRMSFIVSFPDPDQDTRRRLWDHHLAQLDGLDAADPVDLETLSARAELTGGEIRNVVLAAAYQAVGEGTPVGMRHLADAVLREYRKLGRLLPENGFATR
ncbi:ATP-binding protein [Nocardioides sp. YIM 152315]|uniref:ATP-binding protein n=1 Tax=Nocardioides sp. YIM 152315 TaxID=3031760 RepID=UPI0023DC91AC|nr:ATP-binding protein [Nocardioides sp. YIM 152315]MDF1604188.1 ATP-binding protein [Nocardioides sp. YIM 152315]